MFSGEAFSSLLKVNEVFLISLLCHYFWTMITVETVSAFIKDCSVAVNGDSESPQNI